MHFFHFQRNIIHCPCFDAKQYIQSTKANNVFILLNLLILLGDALLYKEMYSVDKTNSAVCKLRYDKMK